MKKITLLGALLVATTMQAQKTFYWPGQRVSELMDGQQYFIYNTAVDGDRSWFLFSDGSALKTNNSSPKNFATSEEKYLFTTVKPSSPLTENHWYLNSIHGIVGIGGQTNNTEIRDLYITRWFGNNDLTKGTALSEDENGDSQDPNTVDTKVFAVTKTSELNTSEDNGYAWNGNKMEGISGEGEAWVQHKTAHPYAFYTVESKEVGADACNYIEELTLQNGKIGKIAFDLQKTFGLVQDGSKYYSNYKSTLEGTYEALVDGYDGSYFHSAYGDEGGEAADPKHYLRAELSKEVEEFYFITKRRIDNNNNRPTSILIEGSNEANGSYTEITTVSGLPTEASDYFYFSDKIRSEVPYKYIRFTPLTTSPEQTRFFTYSEFYVIDATTESDAAIAAVKGLYNCKQMHPKESQYESSILAAGNAFDQQVEFYAFKSGKEEIQAIIAANANNYSDDPSLGQYPTIAYKALENAANTCTTSDEIAAAIKNFKFSVNAPVFMINGAKSEGYQTVGKSIYYNPEDSNNPLYWNKATNKYDKSMLWKFAGLTSSTPEFNTTYSAMNLSEQVFLWNVENMQITEPSDPENGPEQVLITTEGNSSPIHADASGKIVRWPTYTANSASAWTIEYIGESKVIEGIDEEQLAAYAELTTLIAACTPFKDKLGTGLNQFTSDNLLTALAQAEEIVKTDIYTNPDLDVIEARDNLKAAKEALTINKPETGKYYRIKSVAKNKYISSKPVADGRQSLIDDGTDPSTVYYLSEDNRLTNSIAINLDNESRPAAVNLGTTFEFLINNNGYYLIKSTEREQPLYPHYDNGDLLSYDFTGGNYADKLVDAWILEEVIDESSLPKLTKTMTDEYATIAAPVALNIPSEVKAYTAKVNGDKATLTEISGNVIPAGVAAVIKKTGAESSYEFTFAPAGVSENENDLQGVYATYNVPADTKAYVLANGSKGIGFYLLNSEDRTLAANKAYLVTPAEASDIKAFTFDFGDTTGIDNPETAFESEVYYDLQGRRVQNPTKGIYVTKSGKKVLFTK